MTKTHIDHIDPLWSKGRDYQLICGLDGRDGLHGIANLCERDAHLNNIKNNRFVPWRVSYDEIGNVPVEQGDLCLFLDHSTHEWVLEEFLGTWWFEQSRLWGYGSTQSRPCPKELRLKLSEANKGKKVTEETKLKISKTKTGKKRKPFTKEHRRKMSESAKLRGARNRCRTMSLSDPQMPDFED